MPGSGNIDHIEFNSMLLLFLVWFPRRSFSFNFVTITFSLFTSRCLLRIGFTVLSVSVCWYSSIQRTLQLTVVRSFRMEYTLQCFRVAYHGISHELFGFYSYTHETLGEWTRVCMCCWSNFIWPTTYAKIIQVTSRILHGISWAREGVLSYMGYVGMCSAKGYGFLAVLFWNRVWFVHPSLESGMFFRRSYFFIIRR